MKKHPYLWGMGALGAIGIVIFVGIQWIMAACFILLLYVITTEGAFNDIAKWKGK